MALVPLPNLPLVLISAAAIAAPALAQSDSAALRGAVTVEAIRAHQQALAGIATAEGGNRASGTRGYDTSVDYVAEKLRDAGYEVTVQPFHVLSFEETAPPQLARVEPDAETYSSDTDFQTMRNSGAGGKSSGSQPLVDLGSGDGGITRSMVGTTAPSTDPAPELRIV